MGSFRHTVEIGDPQGQRFEKVEALVGTRAIFTLVPASTLERLGVAPKERISFQLPSGRVVKRWIGETRLRIEGREVTSTVVFGESEAEVVLGFHALESVLLDVDLINQRLVPKDALLLALS